MEYFLKRNYYWEAREWPYKNVKPRIIAEEYIKGSEKRAKSDYKFLCFDGEPRWMAINTKDEKKEGGCTNLRVDFFDMEGRYVKFNARKNLSRELPVLPRSFEKMKELSRVLSKGFPFVRVDFYETEEKIYFGELTFFPSAGFAAKLEPEADRLMGEELKLKR